MEKQNTSNAEALICAFVADTPVPLPALLGDVFGSRSTFRRWEREYGLPVVTVPGMGRTVRPSHLKALLLVLRGDAPLSTLPDGMREKVRAAMIRAL
jgi:hypothetical protein